MIYVDVQYVYQPECVPSEQQFIQWVEYCLIDDAKDAELVIRIVDENESADLNQRFRNKPGSTNVLSFAYEMPGEGAIHWLGDLVLCAPVIEREAIEQKKRLECHWAHMVIHGVLHLLGYDHIDDNQALEMEQKEIEILHFFKIRNPYEDRQKR